MRYPAPMMLVGLRSSNLCQQVTQHGVCIRLEEIRDGSSGLDSFFAETFLDMFVLWVSFPIPRPNSSAGRALD